MESSNKIYPGELQEQGVSYAFKIKLRQRDRPTYKTNIPCSETMSEL